MALIEVVIGGAISTTTTVITLAWQARNADRSARKERADLAVADVLGASQSLVALGETMAVIHERHVGDTLLEATQTVIAIAQAVDRLNHAHARLRVSDVEPPVQAAVDAVVADARLISHGSRTWSAHEWRTTVGTLLEDRNALEALVRGSDG